MRTYSQVAHEADIVIARREVSEASGLNADMIKLATLIKDLAENLSPKPADDFNDGLPPNAVRAA